MDCKLRAQDTPQRLCWGVCRLLVKQYVPEIMKAVVALPEQQVCGAIGLCSSSSMSGELLCAAAMRPMLPELLPGTLLPCCLGTPSDACHRPMSPMLLLLSIMCLCDAERPAASRRLLLDQEAGALGDPNPVCQFCEVAVSYVKVRLQKLSSS